jgi:hypothetical protein
LDWNLERLWLRVWKLWLFLFCGLRSVAFAGVLWLLDDGYGRDNFVVIVAVVIVVAVVAVAVVVAVLIL